jgi:hypothetical protein
LRRTASLREVRNKSYLEADLGDGVFVRLEASEGEDAYLIVDTKQKPKPLPVKTDSDTAASSAVESTSEHEKSPSNKVSAPAAPAPEAKSPTKARPRHRRSISDVEEFPSAPTRQRSRRSSILGQFAAPEEDGEVLARVPDSVELPNFRTFGMLDTRPEPFVPPAFGVTFLGTSHGFDPKSSTTGFVVRWRGRRGRLTVCGAGRAGVDQRRGHAGGPAAQLGPDAGADGHPAPDDPHRVCHTLPRRSRCGHDAEAHVGRKRAFAGGGAAATRPGPDADVCAQVTVITTPTIIKSFLRKYSNLTNMPIKVIQSRFIFRSARVGQWMDIFGGEIRVFYAFHTIPCVGFEVRFGSKRIVYSADTFYDPARIQEVRAGGGGEGD